MVTFPRANCICFGWIDHWSCTLDYGLSHLWYPHTKHMFMFNECLIHLCDCTCLNVLHILNYMLIKHKNIFECFYLFLDSVFVLKNIKNFKNNATLFWRLCLVGQASCETLVAAYTKALGEFLVSHGSNSEKHLEDRKSVV